MYVRLPAEFPYEDCHYYTITAKDGRKSVSIFKNDGERLKVTSYARYLYETFHKTILPEGVEVHHKDEDRTHDVIENLEALTFSEHKEQHKLTDTRLIYVYLDCHNCNKQFTVRTNDYKARVKTQKNWFCSRKCITFTDRINNTIKELVHGSKVAYSYHKCRCDTCKSENTKRMKEYKAKKKLANF